MEILNSGSFVPLDNREKIEQLIFTAKTLATEVSRTEGFQSSGPTNHQLGVEMWKGAEYMCRAHEEATIRNLFLSKFLEKLREIERQNAVLPNPVQTQIGNPPTARHPVPSQTQVVSTPANQPVPVTIPAALSTENVPAPQEARDEYLGVISQTLEIDSRRPSYADECKPEFERELAAMHDNSDTEEIATTQAGESNAGASNETISSEALELEERAVTDASAPDVSELSSAEEGAGEEAVTVESPTSKLAAGIDSIVLSEKEPYNFDSCTVTAAIQLLPTNDGIRKCVLSVRSHDFAPQISISEFAVADITENANRWLTEAIGRYRTELPALAAEKIKKAKPVTKKRVTKSNDKGTKVIPATDAKTSAVSTTPSAAQNSETAKDQRNLFAS